MNLLALETSSALFSVALKAGQKYLNYDEWITHETSQRTLPVIQQLLLDGNISLQELDAIVLGIGPGSFTGLRIACSVAQALAFACDNLPIILISSLRVCAQAVFDKVQCSKVLVAMNAYQEEIYWGAYQVDEAGQMQEIMPDSLASPSLVVMPDSGGWMGVGNAWEVYEAPLSIRSEGKLSDIQAAHYPTASALIKLGEIEFLHKKFVAIQEAVPVYLRGQDAWKKSKNL